MQVILIFPFRHLDVLSCYHPHPHPRCSVPSPSEAHVHFLYRRRSLCCSALAFVFCSIPSSSSSSLTPDSRRHSAPSSLSPSPTPCLSTPLPRRRVHFHPHFSCPLLGHCRTYIGDGRSTRTPHCLFSQLPASPVSFSERSIRALCSVAVAASSFLTLILTPSLTTVTQ